MLKRKGIIIILSAPSGAGKSSIANLVMQNKTELHLSISATTREKRNAEIDGKHYYFIKTGQFKQMIDNNELLEYTNVFGNYYGTIKKNIVEKIENAVDVILDIDYIGAKKIIKLFPSNCVSIFILPPSRVELETRLVNRGDKIESIKGRMSEAREQISNVNKYDYVLVNNSLEESANQVMKIIDAERLKKDRIIGIEEFINKF